MKFLVPARFAKSGWMLGVKVYGSLVTAYRSSTHLPWRLTKLFCQYKPAIRRKLGTE